MGVYPKAALVGEHPSLSMFCAASIIYICITIVQELYCFPPSILKNTNAWLAFVAGKLLVNTVEAPAGLDC